MKKSVLIGAGLLAVVMSGSMAMAHSGGVMTALKVKDTDILIDGKLNDAGWKNAEAAILDPTNVPAWQTFKTHLSGGLAPTDAADASGAFRVAYSDNYLYFGFDVKDEAYVNEDKAASADYDSVEVWVDGLGTGGGKHVSAKDAVIRVIARLANGQPALGVARMDTGKDAWKSEDLKLRPGANIASIVTDKGYVVEACIPWYALEPWIGKPAAAGMGIDFQLNDNDTGKDAKGKGIRQTTLAWSGGKDNNWQDTNLFGDVMFK